MKNSRFFTKAKYNVKTFSPSSSSSPILASAKAYLKDLCHPCRICIQRIMQVNVLGRKKFWVESANNMGRNFFNLCLLRLYLTAQAGPPQLLIILSLVIHFSSEWAPILLLILLFTSCAINCALLSNVGNFIFLPLRSSFPWSGKWMTL